MMENREYKFAREDIVTLLCEVTSQYARRNGIHLSPVIVNHIARVMFKPEFWSLL